MTGAVKLNTAGGGSVLVQPASSIASDVTINVPSVSTTLVGTDTTQTLTNKTIQGGTVISGTAVASTSGTSIDFTGIPSWVKRITVMFNGVSTNGSSQVEVRIGSGSVTSSGYSSYGSTSGVNVGSTTGFVTTYVMGSTYSISGNIQICLVSGFVYTASSVFTLTPLNATCGGGNVTLSGTLDRVRITTVNGTDTFDAGSINILYE